MKNFVPRQRRTLHVEVLNADTCIYDWSTERVHALNPSAARVWRLCDGSRTASEIAEAIGAADGLTDHDADAVVALALSDFANAGLLDTPPADRVPDASRRAMMTRIGVAAALLPFVSSIVAPSKLQAQSGPTGNPRTFPFTGAASTFVVPAGVTEITVDAFGAAGGPGSSLETPAGLGGRTTATIAVTPAEVLTVRVGGAGPHPMSPVAAFNGGGKGNGMSGGGGGGGASDVARGGTMLVVAGGGGGNGRFVAGGAGGGLIAASGATHVPSGAGGGGGGTQVSGGAGGAAGSGDGTAGNPGSLGQGGAGSDLGGGAGGGGGYYGGGSAGLGAPEITGPSAGGGGGSSYTIPGATAVVHTAGVRTGDGQIIISWSAV